MSLCVFVIDREFYKMPKSHRGGLARASRKVTQWQYKLFKHYMFTPTPISHNQIRFFDSDNLNLDNFTLEPMTRSVALFNKENYQANSIIYTSLLSKLEIALQEDCSNSQQIIVYLKKSLSDEPNNESLYRNSIDDGAEYKDWLQNTIKDVLKAPHVAAVHSSLQGAIPSDQFCVTYYNPLNADINHILEHSEVLNSSNITLGSFI